MRHIGGSFRARLLAGAAFTAAVAVASAAQAETISIKAQPLTSALNEFGRVTRSSVVFTPDLTSAKSTRGVANSSDPETALRQLLSGTGLTFTRSGDAFLIARAQGPASRRGVDQAEEGGATAVEALIVTAQKREEDIQDVPIAMSAFTQEDLTRAQVAGGPDLMTQVPNMTFTKTNFSSYSIQIRGIGTQAISATTDPAVAVAFNNTPFIRNRFFEQEFYDVERVEVLRGPQGTLYGRNATAGVVNLISAKPKFGFEAKLSGDVANYNSTRLEGMINIPLVEDAVAFRLAGAWTKRDGFVTNEITGNPIDGRDLWSTRLSLRVAPSDRFDANLIWEHFEENDDRLRSGKQLCHKDDRTEMFGLPVFRIEGASASVLGASNWFSQGCLPGSMYSPEAFQTPDGFSLPYYLPLNGLGLQIPIQGLAEPFDPYLSRTQSRDLRVIESTVDPEYWAESDIVQVQLSFDLTDSLTLASETAYNYDELFSKQDLNRFNTRRGAFMQAGEVDDARPDALLPGPFGGIFCDPQVGCADRLVAVDLSTARSRQFSQELRLSSDFDGPFNFSLGANFLRYDTEDKYYVFINTLGFFAADTGSPGNTGGRYQFTPYVVGESDGHECLGRPYSPDPLVAQSVVGCIYMDPNPIGSLNDEGHNYFLSKNPYKLISYAVFGEAYYNVTESLKITGGLRWTVDKKEAPRIPSWVLATGTVGYPIEAVEEQEWREPTGRLTIDWKPELSFTDDTLLYASYARGYKAGGANPPPSGKVYYGGPGGEDSTQFVINESLTKPKTFEAEFIDAFELGAKNTLLDGAVTLNLAAFYYDYKDYQISQIIDRSAVNYNFDAEVWGLELEADWRLLENLKLGLKLGYENTRVGDGEKAIDIMERNAGHGEGSDDPWVVMRPFPTFTENCVLPLAAVNRPGDGMIRAAGGMLANGNMGPCEYAYGLGRDPRTAQPYMPNPTGSGAYPGYLGFNPNDPSPGHNFGEGFFKDLSGNELPNAPHFTGTLTVDYTLPLPNDWLATLHTDLYYQSEAWTRIFNMEGYDKLKAYSNINIAAIFSHEETGWRVMAYVKNVLDRDSITGAFLFSDDVGLTTNVFLTEPRLYGVRISKDFDGGPWWTGASPDHTGPYPFTIELGGALQRVDAVYDPVESAGGFAGVIDPALGQNRDLDPGEAKEVRLTYAPAGSAWSVSSGVRFGKAKSLDKFWDEESLDGPICLFDPGGFYGFLCSNPQYMMDGDILPANWSKGAVTNHEDHTLVDFMVGREVGLGGLGAKVSAGVQYAQFESRTRLDMAGVPDWALPGFPDLPTHTRYDTDLTAERDFKGAGPKLAFDLARRLWDSELGGHVNLDLSFTGGVLFGKQRFAAKGQEDVSYYVQADVFSKYPDLIAGPGLSAGKARIPTSTDTLTGPAARSRSVTTPTFGASLGLSYEIQRFKVSTGYRWERYLDVLDTGWAAAKDADRTFDGPYFKIAVGFGG